VNHYHHSYPHGEQPVRIVTPRQYRKTRSPSPPRRYTHTSYETGNDAGFRRKKMKDSSIGPDLEDVPSKFLNKKQQQQQQHCFCFAQMFEIIVSNNFRSFVERSSSSLIQLNRQVKLLSNHKQLAPVKKLI